MENKQLTAMANRIRFIVKGMYGGTPDIDVVFRTADVGERYANYDVTVDNERKFTAHVEVSRDKAMCDKLYIYEGHNGEGGHWQALVPLF